MVMSHHQVDELTLKDSDTVAAHRDLPASTINVVQAPTVRAFFKAGEQFDLGLKKVAYTSSGQLNGNENYVLGAAFEEHHRGTFAMDAAAKGLADKVEVATDRSAGGKGCILPRNDQQADIIVKTGDKTTLYQAKSRAQAAQTKADLANPKYDNVEKLGPVDHVDDNHSRIQHDVEGQQVESKPLSREQNEQLAREIGADGKSELAEDIKSTIKKEMAGRNAISAAKQAALVSAVLSGAMEITALIRQSNQRELTIDDLQEALMKVGMTTIDASARAGLTVYVSQSFAQSAGQAMGVAAVANVAYNLAKDLFRFSQGDICLDQVGINILRNSVCTGTAFTAGAVGQALGAAAGTSLGTALATTTLIEAWGLGATIGSAAGPVGAVVGAMLFGLGMSLGVNRALTDQSNIATKRVTRDLDAIRDSLQSDDRFAQLRLRNTSVGRMAPVEPQGWRDLVPFLNIFGDMDEFMLRKQELANLRAEAERIEQHSAAWRLASIRDIDVQAEAMRSELLDKFDVAREQLRGHSGSQLAELGTQLRQYQLCYQIHATMTDQRHSQDIAHKQAFQDQRVAGDTRLAVKGHLLEQMQSIPEATEAGERQRDMLKILAKKIAADSLGPQRRYVSVGDVLALMEQA